MASPKCLLDEGFIFLPSPLYVALLANADGLFHIEECFLGLGQQIFLFHSHKSRKYLDGQEIINSNGGMATIRIADAVHPLHPARSATDATTSGIDDGIYSMRAISRSSTRERSRDRWSGKAGSGERETEDDDPGLRQSGDFKHKQVCSASFSPTGDT